MKFFNTIMNEKFKSVQEDFENSRYDSRIKTLKYIDSLAAKMNHLDEVIMSLKVDENHVVVKSLPSPEIKKFTELIPKIIDFDGEFEFFNKNFLKRFIITIEDSTKIIPKEGYFSEYSEPHGKVAELITIILGDEIKDSDAILDTFNKSTKENPIKFDVTDHLSTRTIEYMNKLNCAIATEFPVILEVKIYKDKKDIIVEVVIAEHNNRNYNFTNRDANKWRNYSMVYVDDEDGDEDDGECDHCYECHCPECSGDNDEDEIDEEFIESLDKEDLIKLLKCVLNDK